MPRQKMVLLFAVCLLSFAPSVLSCPGCKEALFEPGQVAQNLATARGYALSIALLLAVPVALMGTITLLVVRARRKMLRSSMLRSSIDTPKLSR